MMNEMIITARKSTGAIEVMKQMAERPVEALTRYYSEVLERRLSSRQTLHLLNAQLAFLMTVFPSMSMVLRLMCLTWLVGAVLRCRESLR
ncbi:MAG: ATP-binding protein [Prevotella sp.]|nr:ATP-binding protein [Prevotella sp.]